MLVLPLFDLATRSSSSFIYRYILPRMGPPPLIGVLARNPFFNMFASGGDLAVLTGHGSPSEYSGQGEVTLWKAGQYDTRQTEGKIIKLLSCDTGQELGPDLVSYGKARAVLAYDADYVWVADPFYHFNPWDDPLAAACLLPVVDGINCLLDGGTAQESLEVEKAGYIHNMDNAGRSFNRSMLKFNYDHAVLFGDGNARISPRVKLQFPFPPPPLLF